MAVVLDTHGVSGISPIQNSSRLLHRLIIRTEEKNGESIFVSAISLVEVIYLAERGRLPLTAPQSLENALGDPMGSVVIAPLDAAVAKAVQKISRITVPTCRIGLSPQPPCI